MTNERPPVPDGSVEPGGESLPGVSSPFIEPETEAAIAKAGDAYCETIRVALRLKAKVVEVKSIPPIWVLRHTEREQRETLAMYQKPLTRLWTEAAKMVGAALFGAGIAMAQSAIEAAAEAEKGVEPGAVLTMLGFTLVGFGGWVVGMWRGGLSNS